MIELCTGCQETEEELRAFLKEHPEFDEDIFSEDLKNNNSLELNGGKGSGNFGHAGRPGLVGGSAPAGSSAETDPFAWFDENKRKEMLAIIKKGDVVKRLRRIKKAEKLEELIPEMREVGFSEEYIDSWRKRIKVIEKEHSEDVEKRRELRERAQKSPEQTEAIDNLVSKITVVRPKDEEWLRRNCSPEMAKAFSDEADKAKEMGIETVRLFLNDKDGTQGELGYMPSTGSYTMQISKKILRDQEVTKARRESAGPNGRKWWTSDKIEGTFAHEFGHCMEWEFLKKFMGPEKKLSNGQSLLKSNYFLPKVRDYCSQLIVNQAKENLSKKGISLDELRENKDYKYMSNYGKTNQFEAIAESFANPNYSAFTKEIYNITMGNVKLSKERAENLKKSIETCEERLSRVKV